MDRLKALCSNTEVSVADGVATVACAAGKPDGFCQDELQTVLNYLVSERRINRLVIDMAGVTRVSSFTVACLGYYTRVATEAGGRLVVASLDELCRKPFQLAGILPTMTLAYSRAEALDAVRS